MTTAALRLPTPPTPAKDTAGSLLDANVPRASLGETAGDVQRRLLERRFETIDLVLVADAQGQHAGVVDLRDLMAAAPDQPIRAVMRHGWPTILPDADQEIAVNLARAASVPVLPVVDRSGTALGCIPPHRLLEVLAHEHREDIHKTVGIVHDRGADALAGNPVSRARLRLPWLLLGLGLSTFGTLLMASFEHTLKANVAIAFYIPAIVYLADAIGTQSEAIAVRGLSLRDWPLRETLAREIATGTLIGLVLGAVAFLGILFVVGDIRLAVGVGVTLIVAGSLASALGLLLPWLLSRLSLDPAFGSGPMATIIQDVLTLFIYFAVMTALL